MTMTEEFTQVVPHTDHPVEDKEVYVVAPPSMWRRDELVFIATDRGLIAGRLEDPSDARSKITPLVGNIDAASTPAIVTELRPALAR